MKQMICYLYEFHNNQKIRNVGFIRVIPYADKVVLQFHGKGLGFHGVEDFEVYLFYVEDDVCYVTSIGHIDGVHGNINSMIEITGRDVTEGEGLDRFDGVLIRQPQGQTYAATWKNVDVNVEHIREISGPEEEVIEEEEIEIETEAIEEAVEEAIEEPIAEAAEEAIEEPVEEAIEEPVEEPIEEMELQEETKTSTISAQQEELFPRYEKIQRQEIARLPRKEWKLANNSFLLHGYYNYKHLLFIQEKEQLYLGVPGVYHKKESEAAKAFGFQQFHRVEEDLDLSEDECNQEDDFGYWCRPVEQLQPDNAFTA